MAPLGMKVILHKTPRQRQTWAPHGVNGWYVGHVPEHYRCYRIFVTQTHAKRIGSTVEFFPSKLNMPKTTLSDQAMQAARDLIHALANPAPASPFLKLGVRGTYAPTASHRISQNVLQTHRRPRRKEILRNYPRMGLSQQDSRLINAGLC